MRVPYHPVDGSLFDTAPMRFENVVKLDARPAEEFANFEDGESWPKWFRARNKMRWTRKKPYGVGATRMVWLTVVINRRVIVVTLLPFLAGCSSAPSRNIFGSYFPSWMICVLIGGGATIVVRGILVKLGIDRELPAPIVVYLVSTIAFSFAAWLLWLA